jgi:UDP-N-acetylmuramoyl-L-alanyl-D-glutamate--2,6-diaminopimelate ligase
MALPPECSLYAHDLQLGSDKTGFTVQYLGENIHFCWNLIGRYNILNCLAALGVCLAKGVPLRSLVPFVENFQAVRGRLEKVDNRGGFQCLC